jgi:hypothetical protein
MSDPTIRLVQTCIACPEQYDAFLGDEQVGYLRLRHGCFRVDFRDCGGETIYEARPHGDGEFNEDERDYYLRFAVDAILRRLRGEIPRPDAPAVSYVIENERHWNGGRDL